MVGTAVVWMPWESHVIRQGDFEATFSAILHDVITAHPYVTLCAGIIIGHIIK